MSGSEFYEYEGSSASALPEHVLREIANEPGRRLALRSPAPQPVPDAAEQLVAVRAAIASFRGHARQAREVLLPAVGTHYDRRADVLEHVLRRLIREIQDGR